MKKLFKRYLLLLLTITIVFSSSSSIVYGVTQGSSTVTMKSEEYNGIATPLKNLRLVERKLITSNEILSKLSKSSEFKDSLSDWHIMGMVAYGKKDSLTKKDEFFAKSIEIAKSSKSVTDYERVAISLSSMGNDITKLKDNNGNIINLLEKIYNFEKTSLEPSLGTINGYIFGLLAYDSGEYKIPSDGYWTREKIIENISKEQHTDGGWGFGSQTSLSDPDLTAIAISSLTPYRGEEKVKNIIDRGIAFLSKKFKDDGGYVAWGSKNSNSLSMVLVALSGLGIDGDRDERFIKEDKSLLDNLLDFRTENGFGYTDNIYDPFATEQAFRGLTSYTKFLEKGAPYNIYSFGSLEKLDVNEKELIEKISEVKNLDSKKYTEESFEELSIKLEASQELIKKEQKAQSEVDKSLKELKEAVEKLLLKNGNVIVGLEIKGDKKRGTIFKGSNIELEKGLTVFDFLEKITNENKMKLKYSGTGNMVYIQGIDGLEELDNGPRSGWMFKINGKNPESGAGSIVLNNGDQIVYRYVDDYMIDSEKDIIEIVKEEKENILESYKQAKELSELELLSIALSEGKLPQSEKESIIKKIVRSNGKIGSTADIAKTSILLEKLDIDTTDIDGINLLQNIYNNSESEFQKLDEYGLSLIAITNGKYIPVGAKNNIKSMLDIIAEKQNQDGGFSEKTGSGSDINTTSLVLTALSPFGKNTEIKKVIDKGIKHLEDKQESDGTYIDGKERTSKAISNVIIALTANNINPDDIRFVKEEKTLMEVLLSFKSNSEGYIDVRGGNKNNDSTAIALQALSSYQKHINNTGHIYFADKDYVKDYNPFIDEMNISNWAKKEVLKAQEEGIIVGDGTGYLDPKREVTRAEFVKTLLLVKGEKPALSLGDKFTDLDKSLWYTPYIEKAYDLGLVDGTGENKFSPNDKISREDMSVLIYRAYKLTDKEPSIIDLDKIYPYAKRAVGAVIDTGIIIGVGENRFDPKGKATREMSFTTIIRALEKFEHKVS